MTRLSLARSLTHSIRRRRLSPSLRASVARPPCHVYLPFLPEFVRRRRRRRRREEEAV